MEMRINVRNRQQMEVNGQFVENVKEIIYLGSIASRLGGTDEDTEQSIRMVKGVFARQDLQRKAMSRILLGSSRVPHVPHVTEMIKKGISGWIEDTLQH